MSTTAMDASTKVKQMSGSRSSSSFALMRHVRWEHLLAGISGGVLSTLVLHPLDLVKIRFQVNEGYGVAKRPQYQGITHAFRSIVWTSGLSGLYQGVIPNIWGAGASWGLYFFFYNSIKTWMQDGNSKLDLGPTKHMLAASEAGLMTLILTNPIWVTKTRLCLQYERSMDHPGGKMYYTGMFDALKKIYKMEGLRGLYKGFIPGAFGVSHGAIQFMVYEELKTTYNNYFEQSLDVRLSSLEYVTFAAISKIVAATSTYPYQVVRSRLQDQHREYSGVVDVIRQTWKFEGLRGMYKGFNVYLLHVTPNICIVFLVYEYFTSLKLNKIKQIEQRKR